CKPVRRYQRKLLRQVQLIRWTYTNMATHEIKQAIKSVSVKGKESTQPETVVKEVLQDVDPITLRIPRRPEGALESISEKIVYSCYEGKKTVYITVSFMPVKGVVK